MTDSAADLLQSSIDGLRVQLTAVTDGLADVERQQNRANTRQWVVIVLAVVVALALCWATVSNSQASDRNRRDIAENNRLLCPVLAIMGSNDPPSSTVRGQQIADAMNRLARSPQYACW